MSNWTARANAAISRIGPAGTVKTDKSPLSSVLAVRPGAVYQFPGHISSVSSVGVGAVCENTQLSRDLIDAAMKVCDQYGDDESARTDMCQQCRELPPHLQQDLLNHFRGLPRTFLGDIE